MNRRRIHWAAGGLLTVSLGLAMIVPAAEASPETATASRPGLPAVSYKYTLSKIVWTGSREAIVACDSHGDLYYFWAKSGSSAWHKELVAKASAKSRYRKPVIAWTGQAVLIVAIDNAGDLVTFNQHAGTAKWRYKRIARASGGRYEDPAVTSNTRDVLISVGRTSGQLVSFQRPVGGTTWVRKRVGSGDFGPSSITTWGSKADQDLGLVTATSHGYEEFWWEIVATPGWHEETIATAGVNSGYTGGSVTATASDVEVSAAYSSGLIDFWTQPIGGSGWTDQQVVSGAIRYSAPQLAWASPPDSPILDFLATASDTGTLDVWWKDDGGATWHSATIAAGGTKARYANPAIAITKTAAVITAIDRKTGDVLAWSQVFYTSGWHRQLVAKG